MTAAASTREMRSSAESTSHRHLQRSLDWTGRTMAWPPRSPDFAPKDFFLWSHIKALIYTSPVDSEEEVTVRIVEVAATLRQQPGIFERIRQSLLLRCRLRIEVVAVLLNVCSKLIRNTTFFQNTSVVLLDFQT